MRAGEMIRQLEQCMTLSEIARRSGVPLPTVHQLARDPRRQALEDTAEAIRRLWSGAQVRCAASIESSDRTN